MVKRVMNMLVLFSVLVASVSVASAQNENQGQQQRPGSGGFSGRGFDFNSPTSLLMFEQVQKELKLSDEQKTKLREVREANRPSFGQDTDAAKREEAMKEVRKKIAEILNADQNKRLEQISWHVQGARAFGDAKVQKELALTDDQKESVKTALAEEEKQMGELRSSAGQGADRAAAFAKMGELRTTTKNVIVDSLTEDQVKKWEALVGAKFELQRGNFGGRRSDGDGNRPRPEGQNGNRPERPASDNN